MSKYFNEWIEKYDYEKSVSECGKSYYDSDTGLMDYESARYDEMKDAFDAGVASVSIVNGCFATSVPDI